MIDADAFASLKADRERLVAAIESAGGIVRGSAVNCPFHRDRTASGSIHQSQDGKTWLYTCHKCTWNGEKNSGDAVAVTRLATGTDFAETCRRLGVNDASTGTGGNGRAARSKDNGQPKTTPKTKHTRRQLERTARAAHVRLLNDPAKLENLNLQRGIPRETVETFKVGFFKERGREWWLFPITRGHKLVGIKLHAADRQSPKAKWLALLDGEGRNQCYPLHIGPPRTVYLVPGELKGLALVGLGCAVVAITSGEGALGKPADLPGWLFDLLIGREVAIIPDDDDTGRAWGAHVRDQLSDAGIKVRIINVGLDAENGLKDIGDWVTDKLVGQGCKPPEVVALLVGAKNAPAWESAKPVKDVADDAIKADRPNLIHFSDVAPESVRWLWPGRIPCGKVTLIAGDPGLGKSLISLDIAARVTTGRRWPDADNPNPPGGVVLMSAEDDAGDTIRPRLDAAGANVNRVVLLDGIETFDPDDGRRVIPVTIRNLNIIEAAIDQTPDCGLVVVDPISAFLGTKVDSHVNAEVRAVLAPLAALASSRNVAILAITHLRKGEGAAIYRAMGSLAFVAAARAAWAVCRDKDDPEGKRRLFLPIKNNLAADTDGLAFALGATDDGAPHICWGASRIKVNTDEALAPQARRRGPEASDRIVAEEWLRSALADGPRKSKELVEEAHEIAGISKSTLDRAKLSIGVESFREKIPGPWLWRLPNCKIVNKVANSPVHTQLGDLGDLAFSGQKTPIPGDSQSQDRQGRQVSEEGHELPKNPSRLDQRVAGNRAVP